MNCTRCSSRCPARAGLGLNLALVQTSCGMAVPCFSPAGDREMLKDWAAPEGRRRPEALLGGEEPA